MNLPRIVIAGLSGGSGKTLVSLGVVRALARSGLAVKPCKKGPDYIDAWWLALAAGHPATNLDPYFLDAPMLRSLFWTQCGLAGDGARTDAAPGPSWGEQPGLPGPSVPYDLAVIEGNRGLFDGRDLSGSSSTAELARILGAPVVVVMDCTKMTRTAAAIVSGLRHFEQGVHIAGVILNRTAGPRHRGVLRETIEHYTDVPVLGILPKIADNPIPERHMGLVSGMEHEACVAGLDRVADIMAEHVDLHRLRQVACAAPPPQGPVANLWSLLPGAAHAAPEGPTPANADQGTDVPHAAPPLRPRIGYVHDAALWFYYHENLLALRHAGAELVRLSLLDDAEWPQLDGLYLGGGFPETLAAPLSANRPALDRLRALSESGLPIYAECGGFMVLGRSIVMDGIEHPMADIFPVRTVFHPKPQGLGYVDAAAVLENPFHPVGATFRGHEFHYSRCVPCDAPSGTSGASGASGASEASGGAPSVPSALRLTAQSGHVTGMGDGRDGLLLRNTLAAYTHIFAPAVPHWAPAMVRAAREHRMARASKA